MKVPVQAMQQSHASDSYPFVPTAFVLSYSVLRHCSAQRNNHIYTPLVIVLKKVSAGMSVRTL